jgi:hypothetical protein
MAAQDAPVLKARVLRWPSFSQTRVKSPMCGSPPDGPDLRMLGVHADAAGRVVMELGNEAKLRKTRCSTYVKQFTYVIG